MKKYNKKNLQKFLIQNLHKKLLFFCIGNIFRGDDGVGEYIFNKIKLPNNWVKINGGNAPENYIGKIEKIKPDNIIVIDCMDFGLSPGTIIFNKFNQFYNLILDTHSNLLNLYLDISGKREMWYILGIQPRSFTNYEKISIEVKKSADEIIKLINTSVNYSVSSNFS